ncbi:hypothetical protein V8F20_004062 [Naviculisporaceae sp. PSN 640]
MPINASFTLESTIGQSLFPIRRGNQTEFAFWDAVQHSSLLSQFSKLQFRRRLGEGATFLVDLFEDPDDDKSESDDDKSESDDETHTLVAVKTAKVFLGYDGTSGTLNQVDLYSLLLEIQVLQHGPLVSHPNIIDILGMDWTISETGVQVPRVVVEYAAYGTLNAFLHDYGKGVGLATRLEIWSDISMGLEILHRCQLVHGDMKLPNILVFENSEIGRGVIAKLSDFGGTLTDFDLEPEQMYRGSNRYRAPELIDHPRMGLAELQKCDIFALGLCFCEILDNGHPYYQSSTGCFGGLAEGCFLDSDLNRLLSRFSDRITNPIEPHPQTRKILSHSRESQVGPDFPRGPINSAVNDLLRQMLQPNPHQRIAAGTVTVKLERLIGKPALGMLGNKDLFVNPLRRSKLPTYNPTRSSTTPFETQRHAVAGLQQSLASIEESERGKAYFVLADCYAHGYGVATDFEKSLGYLAEAASHGSRGAETILPRVVSAIHASHPDTQSANSCLKRLSTDTGASTTRQDPTHELLRQKVNKLENQLARAERAKGEHVPGFVTRVKEWVEWDVEFELSGSCLIEQDDGSIISLSKGTESAFIHLLETNQLQTSETVTVTSTGLFQTTKLLLSCKLAACGWMRALEWLWRNHPELLRSDGGSKTADQSLWNPGSALLSAMMYGRMEVVRFLLVDCGITAFKSTNPESFDHDINGLHFLYMLHDSDIDEAGQLLCKAGADPNMVSPTGNTQTIFLAGPDVFFDIAGPPLDTAIQMGHRQAVRVLLKLGADPLLKIRSRLTKAPHTPLGLAISFHLHDIVDDILVHISTTRPEQMTTRVRDRLLLSISGDVYVGKVMFIRWLLHGSNYETACSKTVSVCISHGAEINKGDCLEEFHPLVTAAMEGAKQQYVLETLLRHGADPNGADRTGLTALEVLYSKTTSPEDLAKAAETLIKHGARVDLDTGGAIALHVHAAYNSTAVMQVLLAHGAPIESRPAGQVGRTPLMVAAAMGRTECVSLLLEHGADILARAAEEEVPVEEPTSHTALHLAAHNGSIPCVRVLLSWKGVVYSDYDLGCALILAIQGDKLDLVQFLLREYAYVFGKPAVLQTLNIKAGNGFTPLSAAASLHSMLCLHEVMRMKPELDFRDPNDLMSFTALGVALLYGRVENAIYLLEHGASPFCRGDPSERNVSIITEYIKHCSYDRDHELGGFHQFGYFLQRTKSWIDRYNLLGARNWAGLTPIQFAVFHGKSMAVKELVRFGAIVSDTVTGMRCTSWADPSPWYLLPDSLHGLPLTTLEFARRLRDSQSEQRYIWLRDVEHELDMGEMDIIVDFLETASAVGSSYLEDDDHGV